jgi:hypothetical protein
MSDEKLRGCCAFLGLTSEGDRAQLRATLDTPTAASIDSKLSEWRKAAGPNRELYMVLCSKTTHAKQKFPVDRIFCFPWEEGWPAKAEKIHLRCGDFDDFFVLR